MKPRKAPRCAAIVLMGLAAGAHAQTTTRAEAPTRPPHCAGAWYPAEPNVLTRTIDNLLAEANPPKNNHRPIALIAPHAGYSYSAPTAAAAYRCLQGHSYRRVIVLAFSHRTASSYSGVDIPAELAAYHTPLGAVPIDRAACDLLLAGDGFAAHPDVDRGEHSLELQLPFLQRALGEFQLVPMLIGRMSDAERVDAAKAILPLIDAHTLLVASTDFTHYGPRFSYQPFTEDVPRRLRELAERAAAPLLNCDCDAFAEHLAKTGDTVCGRGPLQLLLRILSMRAGADCVRTAFDTSGNQTGDWSNSVTYQSFVFTKPAHTLTEAEQSRLLRLARETITSHLNGQALPKPEVADLPPAIRANGACFVTLQNHGRLRGCIGNMEARDPLYTAVIRNAVSACQDGRFVNNPVTTAELEQIHVEISYLTPMCRVTDPANIVVGRHGLTIELGRYRGVLLPQVAYERGWSRAEFLGQVCRKARLPQDAWKQPNAEIYCFTAEVFGE